MPMVDFVEGGGDALRFEFGELGLDGVFPAGVIVNEESAEDRREQCNADKTKRDLGMKRGLRKDVRWKMQR